MSTSFRPVRPQPSFNPSPTSVGGGDWHVIARALILVFFLLLPIEGIARKWLFPNLEGLLGFIRDPVLLVIYVAYLLGLRRTPQWIGYYGIAAGALTLFAIAQTLLLDGSAMVLFLGLRSYVLYVPLAFIMADILTVRDFRTVVRVCLWISIPIAILVFLQFNSPVISPINKGTSDSIVGRFTVVEGIVRPYGPFTFAQAQATFAAMMLAVWLIAWERRHALMLSWRLLAPAGFAVLTMGALSGSRTYFGSAILIGVAYVIAGLTHPSPRHAVARITQFAVALGAFLVVFIVVFPRSFQAMTARQASATAIEGSTVARSLGNFGNGLETLLTAPFFGHGLGAGTNAAARILGEQGFYLGETEWGRIINEAGVAVGALVLLARVAFTIWLGWLCLAANRRTGDGAAIVMFGFAFYLTSAAQTTGQNQLLSFCWFSVGLTLWLCRYAGVNLPGPASAQGRGRR